jgi:hypothetical protein
MSHNSRLFPPLDTAVALALTDVHLAKRWVSCQSARALSLCISTVASRKTANYARQQDVAL